ncbi:MAG: hypothetical protein A2536_06350 [Candidatus Firestonebacteria bacterium RIFOXYD2_FULL_39_29]|nr:MAG: hypothetical protein A2536_06350 [Candidatus Firestonebacteria bacterium RIFOXYD2_FULL_39_29]
MIELKEYQKIAIEGLKNKTEKLLRSPENEVIIFQAPTGSGKTVMVSELLKEIVRNKKGDKSYSFVWVSVRMLHEQSKEKLEKYYEDDRLIKCSYFEDLEDRKINENEILFINWHSINKKDINIFVKENERDNNLNSIIRNTKEEGRTVILVIDESHHSANSEKSKELIEVIGPKVTIEVSATPHLTDKVSEIEKVHLTDVKSEEMIKMEIVVNPEFKSIQVGSKSADELVIDQALKKRKDLKLMFENEGSNINPLVLIQLPDSKGDLINKKEDVEKILESKGITEKNGKLAIWLSEEKTDTLPNIEKNDNDVEVLVFKQAIALGWDCPRASILVIFRELKSFVFTIQTIGRIMRMPELRYYVKNEELNKGFVFTNLPSIEITEDYAKDYISIYEGKRDNKLYEELALSSVFMKRQRERTRLSGAFTRIFVTVADVNKLQNKINVDKSKIINPIISDGKIKDVDKPGKIEDKGQVYLTLSEKELQEKFDRFIIQNCSPYAPVDSSDRMKTAIYQYFKQKYKIEKYDPKVQGIVLGKENEQAFVDVINLAKERYKKEVIEKLSETKEKEETPEWEVPIVINYNKRYKKEDHEKSIIKPFYVSEQSDPERKFVELLDKSSKVKWWYKNGEGEVKYFAVPYKDENGIERSFYVDFVVKFKDGRIGLFDTKSGMTAEQAGPRAEGLQKYIKKELKKVKKLEGGIVISVKNSWRVNSNDKYKYNKDDLSEWKILDI